MDLVMEDIQCSGVTFIRNFDSANLAKVDLIPYDISVLANAGSHSSTSTRIIPEIPDLEFNIWTIPDCGGTEFENGNRTWFYFGMRANASSLLIKLNIVDLNKQAKMYSQGMSPVYKVVPSRAGWDRIRDKPTYNNEDEIFTLSFRYRTPDNPAAITYFAFTYPFSYCDLQKMLSNIDAKFAATIPIDNDDIYYARECVCRSLDNRRVDLLTVTSKRGVTNVREARLKNLFPDEAVPRPHRFPDKKTIFISARVHPGETPSSFVFNGLLHLLLNREDTVAIMLRRMYVFKLIPCLNPDGVARGHYRTDARGVNLNRMYLNPSQSLHSSIYAARSLIRYYHYGYEKPDSSTLCSNCVYDPSNDPGPKEPDGHQSGNVISSKVSNMSLEENTRPICLQLKRLCTLCGSPVKNSSSSDITDKTNGRGDVSPTDSGLFLYMDLHGHASKKGIFIYGNHFETAEQNVECMLLAKLMSINNHNFHFTACNFSERNMFIKDKRDGMSRAGSGRVAISTLTGLIKSYTLECNYNTGRLVNILPPTVKERQQKGYALSVPPKYSPSVFEEVGRSLGASILDLTGSNPLTRLPHSEYHSLNGVMEWLRMNCVQELGESANNNNNNNNVKAKPKTSLSQGTKRRPRVRSTPAHLTHKNIPKIRPSSVPLDRKENVVFTNESLKIQPSCSNKIPKRRTGLIIHKTISKKTKSKITLSLKCKNINNEKEKVKNKQTVLVTGRKMEISTKLRPVTENQKTARIRTKRSKTDLESKFQPGKSFVEKPIYTWTVSSSSGMSEPVYNPKEKTINFLTSTSSDPSSSSGFRVNNFSKNTFFAKTKKHTLRRIGGSGENVSKVEKFKKKKRLVKKL